MQKRLFFLIAMMLVVSTTIIAQVTTSSLSGMVTIGDANGEPIIGATVQAVHEPSGTRYAAVSNVDGRFRIQGMRTGGPYTVTVTYIGFEQKSLKGVQLELGETYNLQVWLSENTNELSEVLITGKASKFAAEKTGASTNITSSQITSLPTVSRGITDVTRLNERDLRLKQPLPVSLYGTVILDQRIDIALEIHLHLCLRREPIHHAFNLVERGRFWN